MEDDSQDIYTKGLIDRYAKRARNLEHLSLADWVAWYDLRGKPKNKKTNVVYVDNLPLETGDNDNDDDEEIENNLPGKNAGKKRSKARIIRSVCFNKDVDPEKHYRELIMLFTAWRNEQIDLINSCCQMKEYAICIKDLNDIEEQLREQSDNSDIYDRVATGTQDVELQDEHEGTQDLHPDLNENYDLSVDIGIPSTASNSNQLIFE